MTPNTPEPRPLSEGDAGLPTGYHSLASRCSMGHAEHHYPIVVRALDAARTPSQPDLREALDGPIPHVEDATTWDVPWIVSDTGPNAQQPRWLVHTAGAAVIADVESERHARWIVDRWNREYALASQPAVRDDLPPSNPSLMGDIQQEAER